METKRIVFKKDSSQSWDEDILLFEVYMHEGAVQIVGGDFISKEEFVRIAGNVDVKFFNLYDVIELVKETIQREEHIYDTKEYITTLFGKYGADVNFLTFDLIEKYNG